MKKTLISIAAIAALSGCSSFKVGAACYIPYGVTGQCSATTVEPGKAQEPAASVETKAAAAK